MDYTKICFVVMPFGTKPVGKKKLWGFMPFFTTEQTVDFDKIYDNVFVPAIKSTRLPEGGFLEPHRTDRDFFTGNIATEMSNYIHYSRFVLADITGLNANVFYELGARHSANESGTAIFRQTDSPVPFDINPIKAFPYEYQPEDKVTKSRQLITKVLTESLIQNRIDSPIQKALIRQQGQVDVEETLRDAENAIRNEVFPTALIKYREAARVNVSNPILHLKIGLILKKQGKWEEALAEFDAAVRYSPDYAEAYREKGLAESQLFMEKGKPEGMPTGEESLRKAVKLNPDYFNALSSLGGLLKQQERYEESLEAYRKATDLSNGHSYPLLNEITVQSLLNKRLSITERQKLLLNRAQHSLQIQTKNIPPYNKPWSFFDLSTVHLFLQKRHKFLRLLECGINMCEAGWQIETHLKNLRLLKESGVDSPSLDKGIEKMDKALKIFG